MQSIEQYGFNLIPADNITEEQYLLLKRNIELICRNVEKTAKKFVVKNASIAQQIDGSRFATVNISESRVLFAIYDLSAQQIIQEATTKSFEGFTDVRFERFNTRCSNVIEEISKGRKLNMGSLDEAWKNAIENTYVRTEEQPAIRRGRSR